MMPVPFPYGNQPAFGSNMHPNYPFNYNPYYPTFCPNPNGLLPVPPPPRPLMAPPIANKPNVNLRELPRPLLSFGRNDFMSFIEQKTKPISELNPFANEFSSSNQIVSIPKETNSSYQLIFDNLIEQSLQSIDAIKKASKTVSVNHVSTQYNQSIEQINRSTQTSDHNAQHKLFHAYTLHIIRLMNKLHENFQYLSIITSENDLRCQLRLTNYLFDELYDYLVTLHEISSEDCSKSVSSSMIDSIADRIDRLISSTPITIVTSKICLLCQKPVNESDDVMHKLCRLLSSPQ
ncbi:unnamed protein product [Adineta ricciae]|uniref:Uncharacterized protein n=1 Tax=Adineta ricciae TaxID=249248 RepID=A0A815VX34_ADIRI|nr:unnamed protein product [Adineta ricciae]